MSGTPRPRCGKCRSTHVVPDWKTRRTTCQACGITTAFCLMTPEDRRKKFQRIEGGRA